LAKKPLGLVKLHGVLRLGTIAVTKADEKDLY
jgi:hypothetical protein